MTREDTLDRAREIVLGNREAQYGSPENNFKLISKFWSTYLEKDISSEDVANMMMLLKIARAKSGKYVEDNYIDICGYAACANELYEVNHLSELPQYTLSERARAGTDKMKKYCTPIIEDDQNLGL